MCSLVLRPAENIPRAGGAPSECARDWRCGQFSRRQGKAKAIRTRRAIRAPGTIHAYQAVSEKINRSLGLVTPSLCVFYPAQRKFPKLFSQKRTGLLNRRAGSDVSVGAAVVRYLLRADDPRLKDPAPNTIV